MRTARGLTRRKAASWFLIGIWNETPVTLGAPAKPRRAGSCTMQKTSGISGAPSWAAWAARGPIATITAALPLSPATTRSASAFSFRRSYSVRAWAAAPRLSASSAGRQAGVSVLLSTATSAAAAGSGAKSAASDSAATRSFIDPLLGRSSRGQAHDRLAVESQDLRQVHEDDEALLELGDAPDVVRVDLHDLLGRRLDRGHRHLEHLRGAVHEQPDESLAQPDHHHPRLPLDRDLAQAQLPLQVDDRDDATAQ